MIIDKNKVLITIKVIKKEKYLYNPNNMISISINYPLEKRIWRKLTAYKGFKTKECFEEMLTILKTLKIEEMTFNILMAEYSNLTSKEQLLVRLTKQSFPEFFI
jgi:hypothetical protein